MFVIDSYIVTNVRAMISQVECTDEAQANKAFKEVLTHSQCRLQNSVNSASLQANALQTLQHPYVCGYKEFFVNWDREVS